MKPRRCPHVFPAPLEQGAVDQDLDRPAPVSMPQTVRFPDWVRNPQARLVKVRKVGAVNSGEKQASGVISGTRAGTASGSISRTRLIGGLIH